MVAKAAACSGTKICPIDRPRVNISSRAHHRLVSGPSRARNPIEAAVPTRPIVTCRRGPSLG